MRQSRRPSASIVTDGSLLRRYFPVSINENGRRAACFGARTVELAGFNTSIGAGKDR